MAIPSIELSQVLQSVSTMIRDSLISTNPALRDIDFSHLQAYVPPTPITEDTIRVDIQVKPTSTSVYKLLSKQVFTFSRIDAHDALNSLGFKDRTFTKDQYDEVVAVLGSIGTFTVMSGNPKTAKGDAVIAFNFGSRLDEITQARFLDFSNEHVRKEEYDIAFKGIIKFTFTGEYDTEQPEETEEQPKDDRPTIDVAQFFKQRDLGNIFNQVTR